MPRSDSSSRYFFAIGVLPVSLLFLTCTSTWTWSCRRRDGCRPAGRCYFFKYSEASVSTRSGKAGRGANLGILIKPTVMAAVLAIKGVLVVLPSRNCR